ncbi:ribosomal rna processing protein [Moniliophthora roreri MCA 2997]|uniref:Ribosomal rna processing protein n=1 Tax=Moniliophthora roreri (strain MCA 2997) TaxID=1381753 RepID=V2XEG2_MONRO|nr:ribosomal rna processing protein [Moniliophthora roreri MCA 2997]
MTAAPSGAPPLGKYLASTEKKVRDKAIKNLAAFLSDPEQNEISKSEMLKLWKGIFYCFWMSDKPLVQQALASELADIVLAITSTSSSLAFLSGFWEMIVREWSGIDRLRIDKYYMLVRRFVNTSFRLLMQNDWDAKICEEYNHILSREGGPLCPADMKVPTSLTYHLSEIYLEELDEVLGATPSTSSPPAAPLFLLLAPFFNLSALTLTSGTYKFVQSSLFEPLLASLKPQEESEDENPRSRKRRRLESGTDVTFPNLVSHCCLSDPSEKALSITTIREKLVRKIFEVASEPDTRDSNRKKMYALWEKEKEEESDDETDN